MPQPDRSNGSVTAAFDGPKAVKGVMQLKCYECHSNETKWPWYSYISPISWYIADHVIEGREELNFSKWGEYSKKSRTRKMEEIYDEVADGYMPLESYLITHPGHVVTEEELDIIEEWAFGD
ncbi:heme-binding domain-containing protein [Puniceicoccaceae bacterium K14]|nr:heme-binding domain-containing protein [Puniceicoccaceae bacterium K14]